MSMSIVSIENRIVPSVLKSRRKAQADCMFVLGVLSTFILFFNIKVAGISMFKFTAFGFGTYIGVKNRGKIKKSLLKYEYMPYFAVTIISSILIMAGDSPYKEYSIRSLIDFFFIIYLCLMVATCNNIKLRSFFNGIRVSCYVQIAWCFFQIAFWYVLHVDINKAIFVDGLHLMESVSKYNNNGVLCISGISHHPSNLIVVIIFTLFLVKSAWKWPICAIIALASRNSTTLIAIIVCVFLYLVPSITQFYKKRKISKRRLLVVVIAVVVIFAFIFSGGDEIANRIGEVLFRIQSAYNGTAYDGSTIAHASYYTFLPKVWERFSTIEKLFGYSYGWTGGMFYYFFGSQYSLIFTRPTINWGVESDPMNLVYSIGIIGAIVFYWWLLKIALKGKNLNNCYLLMILCLVAAGIFYCIQYSLVIVIEVALTVAIHRNIDIFAV